MIRRVISRLKRIQRPVVRAVQVGILYPSLFLLYFVGFGLARLILTLFARRILKNRPPTAPAEGSRWRIAEGYSTEEAGLLRQS